MLESKSPGVLNLSQQTDSSEDELLLFDHQNTWKLSVFLILCEIGGVNGIIRGLVQSHLHPR